MGATDIHLINQGKGAGVDANKFMRSNGSDAFVMDYVANADINWTGLTNNVLPKYNGTSLVDSGVEDDGTNISAIGRGLQVGDIFGGTTFAQVLVSLNEIFLNSQLGLVVIGDTTGTGNSNSISVDDRNSIITLAVAGDPPSIVIDNSADGGVVTITAGLVRIDAALLSGFVTISGGNLASIPIGTGVDTFITTPSSANLAAAVTDEIGTGNLLFNTAITTISFRDTSAAFNVSLVFSSSPALTVGKTLTIDMVNGNKTLRLAGDVNFQVGLTFNGTGGTTMTFPGASTTVAGLGTTQTFTGICTFNVGSTIASGVNVTGTNGPQNSVQNGSYELDFGLATSAGYFSNISLAGDAIVRTVNAGTRHLLFSNQASGGIKFATGTASNNDTQKMYLSQAGGLYIGTAATDAGANNIQTAGKIIAGASIRLKNFTVATLPAGTQGDMVFVTDALAPGFLTIIVGGGAIVTPVFYNGTNWVAF